MSRKWAVWCVKYRNSPICEARLLNNWRTGIQGQDTHFSWFSTKFSVPNGWNGQSVLLNFAAVDYEATVFVNGKKAGFHRGGYFAFTLDVTDHVNFEGDNEL